MIPEGVIEPDFEISTFPENFDHFPLKFGHFSGILRKIRDIRSRKMPEK